MFPHIYMANMRCLRDLPLGHEGGEYLSCILTLAGPEVKLQHSGDKHLYNAEQKELQVLLAGYAEFIWVGFPLDDDTVPVRRVLQESILFSF